MNQNNRGGFSKDTGMGRPWAALWKRTALAAIAAALVIGLAGCSLDDLLPPMGGDIPFDQEYTTPPDMGAVDNTPTVPDDDLSFGEIDFRPL